MIREGGRIIFPEAFTEKGLKKLELEDPWTYWTQYVNNPFKSSFQELNSFSLNSCELDYDDGLGHSVIFFTAGEEHRWYLKDCDVIQVCDPAASEKGRSSQTSRSAHIIAVCAPDERVFVIGGHADYVAPSKIYDWLFQGHEAYKNYMRLSGMEMQGPFKVFEALMRDEQERRRKYIGFRAIKTKGDKDSRIRTQMEPLLRRGLLYSVPSFIDDIHAELKVFPDSPKKDVIDALSMALAELQIPEDPKTIRRRAWKTEISNGEGDEVTGY
jgi:predicted phage terminase large subunit-like protein